MSELLVLALKFAFLALLWVFILFAGNIIRTDLFGKKVAAERVPLDTPPPALKRPPKQRKGETLPTTLRITRGKQVGLTMNLGDSLQIGRSADCQLILDDDYVSTRHARIYRMSTGYWVEDLGSTNGTYLNENRITSAAPFTTSDTLRIGRTLLALDR